MNTYTDNVSKPIEHQGQWSKVKVTLVFVCYLCAWYYLNQLAWIHEVLYRHVPRAVLSLEQGLTFLYRFYTDLCPIPL